MKQQTECPGTRKDSGKDCHQPCYICWNCNAVGCENYDCDIRQFEPVERCMNCGHPFVRYPYYGETPINNREPSKPGGRSKKLLTPPPIPWRYIVGGILAVIVIFAVTVFLKAQNTLLIPTPSVSTNLVSSNIELQTIEGLCTCYDAGFKLAEESVGVLSPEYETGFLMCRKIHNIEGGQAWTAGWNARFQTKPWKATCKRYIATSRRAN